MDDLAGPGPAVRRRTARRPDVRDRAAHARRDDRRSIRRMSSRVHDGLGRRLDREADRRVSQTPCRRRQPSPDTSSWWPMTSSADGSGRASSRPTRSPPNQVEEYTIDLHTQDYRFLPGTGSWCRSRAPGSRSSTGTRNGSCPTSSRRPTRIPIARETVYRSGPRASYLDLPVETGRRRNKRHFGIRDQDQKPLHRSTESATGG